MNNSMETESILGTEQEDETILKRVIRTIDSKTPPEIISSLVKTHYIEEADSIRIEAIKALIKVQAECTEIVQNASNGNVRYATLEQWTKAIRPILAKHNFALFFSMDQSTSLTPGEEKIVMVASLIHANGYEHIVKAYFPMDRTPHQRIFDNGNGNTKTVFYERTSMQNMGATITYARRYLLGMLLNITTTQDDNDGCAVPAHKSKIEEIKTLIQQTNTDPQRILKYAGVTQIDDISWEKAAVILTKLKTKIKDQ